MTISICRNCQYEQSDCKGDKSIDTVICDYFKRKLAIKYPVRIEELEGILEQADRSYDILLKENEALVLRADRLEAENKELKAELDIRQAKAYEYDKLYDKYVEMHVENNELKDENKKLKAKIEERVECGADCDKCKNKCRAWQNGFNAKGGNISFDSIQMLRRIVKEVEPEWIDNNCISCAWFNNLKGVGGYCAYHNNKTTAKGGCNRWAKERDAE